MAKCFECDEEIIGRKWHPKLGWRTFTDRWTEDDVFCKDCYFGKKRYAESSDGKYGVGLHYNNYGEPLN